MVAVAGEATSTRTRYAEKLLSILSDFKALCKGTKKADFVIRK